MNILLDMDGVMVDFAKGLLPNLSKCLGREVKYEELDDYYFLNCLQSFTLEFEFWNNVKKFPKEYFESLEWNEHGYKVYSSILDIVKKSNGRHNLFICTKPFETLDCMSGKLSWIKKNCPEMLDKVIMIQYKHRLADKNTILIDDYFENIKNFNDCSGKSILYPANWNDNREIFRQGNKSIYEYVLNSLSLIMN